MTVSLRARDTRVTAAGEAVTRLRVAVEQYFQWPGRHGSVSALSGSQGRTRGPGASCELSRSQTGLRVAVEQHFSLAFISKHTETFSVTLFRDTILPRECSCDNNVVTTVCLRDRGSVLGHCSVRSAERSELGHSLIKMCRLAAVTARQAGPGSKISFIAT